MDRLAVTPSSPLGIMWSKSKQSDFKEVSDLGKDMEIIQDMPKRFQMDLATEFYIKDTELGG